MENSGQIYITRYSQNGNEHDNDTFIMFPATLLPLFESIHTQMYKFVLFIYLPLL